LDLRDGGEKESKAKEKVINRSIGLLISKSAARPFSFFTKI